MAKIVYKIIFRKIILYTNYAYFNYKYKSSHATNPKLYLAIA